MLIALSGKKRSGKDTVGEYLRDNFGFTPVKISGRMKECVKICLDLEDAHIEGDLKEKPLSDLSFAHETTCSERGISPTEYGIIRSVFNHAVKQLNKGATVTPRDLMIWAGNLGRPNSVPGLEHGLSTLFWLERTIDTKLLNYHEFNYVITDLRYQEEFDYLVEDMFVFLVRVNRPGVEELNDLSEKALDNEERWFAIIDNIGTVEDLQKDAAELYQTINGMLTA